MLFWRKKKQRVVPICIAHLIVGLEMLVDPLRLRPLLRRGLVLCLPPQRCFLAVLTTVQRRAGRVVLLPIELPSSSVLAALALKRACVHTDRVN